MKKHLILLLFFISFNNLLSPQNTDEKSKIVTDIDKLSDINLESLKHERHYWSTNSYREFFERLLVELFNPKDFDKREIAFNLFKAKENNKKSFNKNNIITWKDLNLFCGQSNKQKYVANVLDRTNTELGKISFYKLISKPKSNLKQLKKRQEIIKIFLNNEKLFNDLDNIFKNIGKSENIVISFFDKDYFSHALENLALFSLPGLKKLNNNSSALLLKSFWGDFYKLNNIYSTTLSSMALISYAFFYLTNNALIPENIKSFLKMGEEKEYWGASGSILKWLCKIEKANSQAFKLFHGSVLLVGGIYCAFNIKRSIGWFLDYITLTKTLAIITNQLVKFFATCEMVYEKIKQYSVLRNCDEFKYLLKFFETDITQSKDFKDFFDLINSKTFKIKPSFFIAHKGKIIKMYMLMHKMGKKLAKMFTEVARADAYLSIARLYNEFENKKIRFCFAKYKKAEKPFIKINEFWHPLIEENKIVTNSITLGIEDNKQNIILTGPNAGGKSISLKAITIAIWLAQTIGISPAQEMIFTPFTNITTYLNIVDDVGAGQSLFKSEVLRCQELINELENSKNNEFCFQAFDEVFNGTTPKEGMAGAYGVAKYLGTFDNNICLIATHFEELTNLEQETYIFNNYKVSVNVLDDGTIKYPYKLLKGKSNQNVAFDILKEQGFTGNIINVAQKKLVTV